MKGRYEPTLTTVCSEGRCRYCTGCDHRCHHVPPPANFRELVKALSGRKEVRNVIQEGK